MVFGAAVSRFGLADPGEHLAGKRGGLGAIAERVHGHRICLEPVDNPDQFCRRLGIVSNAGAVGPPQSRSPLVSGKCCAPADDHGVSCVG
jgi:hypothetical protein